MRIAQLILAGSITAASIGLAQAQSTAAAGSVVVVPVVAKTPSFETEVTVRNPNPAPITLNIKFYEGVNSGAPGPKVCSALAVPGLRSIQFNLASQCAIAPTGGHFGMLVLEDAAAQKTNVFFAYSRTQTPGFIGFSVEGFPIGAFSGAPADVIGLKSQAAAPGFSSNCFAGALAEAVNYQIVLRDGTTNNLIGAPIIGALQPFGLVRHLDVFLQAGAPGDHSNVRANFTVTSGGQALVGLCTVQENTQLSADFRIAKSVDALNDGQRRVACIGQDDCGSGVVSASEPEAIDGTVRNVYSMIITHPDYVRCDLVAAGADLANLQMRLRIPGDPFASAVFAGGANLTTFYVHTGARNAVNSGVASRWFIDVETRTEGAVTPIEYGINCASGNGTEVPWFRGTAAYDATF